MLEGTVPDRPSLLRRLVRSEAGTSLIDVLAAVFIISIALIPILDAFSLSRQAGWATQRRSLVIGLARARLSEVAAAGDADLTTADTLAGSDSTIIDTGSGGTDTYVLETQVLPYPAASPNPNLREVRVTVSCPNCGGNRGIPVKPITVTTVIRGG